MLDAGPFAADDGAEGVVGAGALWGEIAAAEDENFGVVDGDSVADEETIDLGVPKQFKIT